MLNLNNDEEYTYDVNGYHVVVMPQGDKGSKRTWVHHGAFPDHVIIFGDRSEADAEGYDVGEMYDMVSYHKLIGYSDTTYPKSVAASRRGTESVAVKSDVVEDPVTEPSGAIPYLKYDKDGNTIKVRFDVDESAIDANDGVEYILKIYEREVLLIKRGKHELRPGEVRCENLNEVNDAIKSNYFSHEVPYTMAIERYENSVYGGLLKVVADGEFILLDIDALPHGGADELFEYNKNVYMIDKNFKVIRSLSKDKIAELNTTHGLTLKQPYGNTKCYIVDSAYLLKDLDDVDSIIRERHSRTIIKKFIDKIFK